MNNVKILNLLKLKKIIIDKKELNLKKIMYVKINLLIYVMKENIQIWKENVKKIIFVNIKNLVK